MGIFRQLLHSGHKTIDQLAQLEGAGVDFNRKERQTEIHPPPMLNDPAPQTHTGFTKYLIFSGVALLISPASESSTGRKGGNPAAPPGSENLRDDGRRPFRHSWFLCGPRKHSARRNCRTVLQRFKRKVGETRTSFRARLAGFQPLRPCLASQDYGLHAHSRGCRGAHQEHHDQNRSPLIGSQSIPGSTLLIVLILTVESPPAGYFHPPKMSAVIVPKNRAAQMWPALCLGPSPGNSKSQFAAQAVPFSCAVMANPSTDLAALPGVSP